MGHSVPNAGNPTLHVTIDEEGNVVYEFELSAGMERGFGHVAASRMEFLSEAQWFACLAAAPQGWAALSQVLQTTPAWPWVERLAARANMHGQWPATRALLLKRFQTNWAGLNTRAALDANRVLLAA